MPSKAKTAPFKHIKYSNFFNRELIMSEFSEPAFLVSQSRIDQNKITSPRYCQNTNQVPFALKLCGKFLLVISKYVYSNVLRLKDARAFTALVRI